MAIDLTGGIDPAREYMFAERPDNPEMRDSVSFWVFDDRGEVGLPRIGIEAVASNWEAHGVQVNVAFADGRVYRLRDDGREPAAHRPRRQADGAGRRPARVHVRRTVRRVDDDVRRPGRCRRRRPNWSRAARTGRWSICGSRSRRRWPCRRGCRARCRPDADSQLKTSIVGDLMGGPRYEQLFRATGSVQVAGERARVHRQRPADPPPGRAQAGGLLGPLLAVGAVSAAAGRSATSPIRRGPTASPPSTRATCFDR